MASENSAQEKTEDPTPKRMEKAFEDGQVLSSKELFVFSTLFTGLILYFFSVGFAGQILGEWGGFFNFNMSEFEGESSKVHFILWLIVWRASFNHSPIHSRGTGRTHKLCAQSFRI